MRARPPDRGHGGRPGLRGAGGPRPRHLQPLLSVQEQAEAAGLHLRRLSPGEQLQGDTSLVTRKLEQGSLCLEFLRQLRLPRENSRVSQRDRDREKSESEPNSRHSDLQVHDNDEREFVLQTDYKFSVFSKTSDEHLSQLKPLNVEATPL